MKTISSKMRYILEPSKEVIQFDIFIKLHGIRSHTETFEIQKKHEQLARSYGYLDKGFYLDWKPLDKSKSHEIYGGMYSVSYYKIDKKYVYAITDQGVTFSLPKYLYKDIKGDKKFIMFGKRVSKNKGEKENEKNPSGI